MICGSSPVALAVADLAKRSGFAVTVCAPAAEQLAFGDADRRIEGFALPVDDAAAIAWCKYCKPDSIFTNRPVEVGPAIKA